MPSCGGLDVQSLNLAPKSRTQVFLSRELGQINKCSHPFLRARDGICSQIAGDRLTEMLVCREALWNLEMRETVRF